MNKNTITGLNFGMDFPRIFSIELSNASRERKKTELTFHDAQILDAKISLANDLITQCSGVGLIWIVI